MRISGTIELDGLYVTFNQGTSQQTTLQAGAPASNITLQLPTTADTLAGLAATQTLTNKTINAANNTISNLTVSMLAAGVLNTSTNLTGATDSQVPSALAAKTYADNAAASGLATKADKTTTISAGTGLTGGGDLSANRTIALADTAVTLGSYGSATQVATFTVDQQGRLTAAGNTSIQITESQVTNLVTDLAGKQAADVDLDALAALATTGLIARTGSGSAATRTITAPAAGITISNGDGVSGNPTLALADDLAALEALSGTGIAVRTASNTWAQRSVAAGTGISVTNGDGVSGNPTVAIDSTVATLTGSQTLTNKTLDNPIIDNSLTMLQESTPATPSSGRVRVYPKTDNNLYILDSSGVETQIGSGGGSGTGSLNIVDNPSAASNTTGWTAATNYTVSRDTSNSPLAGVIDSCFAISTTTASSESSTSGVYAAALTMPAALRNSKVQGNLWATVPASSAGVWRLSIYNSSGTRMNLDRDSSGVWTLPGGFTGQLPFTFDATDSTTYTVSFTQTTRTSANTLYATLISIGNGDLGTVPAFGKATTFTPLFNNVTMTTVHATYTQMGQWAYIEYEGTASADATGQVTFDAGSIFTGASIDTTVWAGTSRQVAGEAFCALGVNHYNLSPTWTGSSSSIIFRVDGTAVTLDATNPAADGGFDSGDRLSFKLMIPISSWAGTVSTGPAPVEEFAATSGTWDAASTTTVYGPAGQLIGGTLTTGRSKTVTWQYPIQAGDQIIVEASRDQVTWVPLNGFNSTGGIVVPGINPTATDFSGVAYHNTSSTTTVVTFGRYLQCSDAAVATNWPSSGNYWRVRKYRASALPYQNAGTDGSAGLYKAGLVPGYTGGAAIPAGFIGESRTFTNRTVTGTLGTWAVNTIPLDTLTPGVWLVSVGFVTVNSAATSYVEGAVSTNNSVDGTGIITSSSVVMSSIGTAANNWSSAMRPVVVNTATSQALYAKSFSEDAAQNATIYGSAIRIA